MNTKLYIAEIRTRNEGVFTSYPTDNRFVAKMDGDRMCKEFRVMKVEVVGCSVVLVKPVTVSREGRIF